MNTLRPMVERVRQHVEAGNRYHADILYRLILKDTSPPKGGEARVAHGEACVWYAREALSRAKFGTAADWYYEAIAADPLAVDYRLELCVKALIPMGMFRDAKMEAERATRIEPGYARAWRTLGGLLHKQGDVAGAIAAYERQILLSPGDPVALLDRATIALDTADYDSVRALCEPVLATEEAANAKHCLAMVAYREGRHEDAVALYDQAIAGNCYDPNLARWNKSLALHSIGRYREGWAEHEYRGKQTTDASMARLMNRFTLPIWDGEPAPARIHVHSEMGHGDVIAMARYLPLLVARGYDVRLEVPEPLVKLMTDSLEGVTVLPRSADYPAALGIPAFDYHIPMLSLPYLFETELDTVPWSGPYLKADPTLVAKYRPDIPPGATGLCWSSGIRHEAGIWMAEYGKRKSMHFSELWPLLGAPPASPAAARFVSLQIGPERQQRESKGDRVLDVLPETPTWADTAALVACLDLVITVDTSVAHLAGAMGKPVWVMTGASAASWHWMTERAVGNLSPWYPSARLFRQETAHEWTDVVERIAKNLQVPA